MVYRVIGPDGRVKMHTTDLQYVRPEEHKAQRAAGCSFEVADATPEELAELARQGIRFKTRRAKC